MLFAASVPPRKAFIQRYRNEMWGAGQWTPNPTPRKDGDVNMTTFLSFVNGRPTVAAPDLKAARGHVGRRRPESASALKLPCTVLQRADPGPCETG